MERKRKGQGQPWKKGFVGGIYVLTGADIKNRTIRLAKAGFLFDKAVVAGSEDAAAAETLTVEFSPGGAVERFLFGPKKLMSDRTEVTGGFFDAIGAKAGDRLLIERAGQRHIRISKAG